MNVMAGSWLMASVCMVRMIAMSSTIFAVFGSSSEIQAPDLSVLGELENRRCDGKAALTGCHRRQALTFADGLRKVFVVPVLHLRLVVEEVHLRRRAHHVQIDGALGFWREVRDPGATGGLGYHARQCGNAESTSASRKELPPRLVEHCLIFGGKTHLFNTSSRFSTWLASIVIAASSAVLRLTFGEDSPTSSNFFASAGFES